jgi:TPR repeat protein
MSAISLEAAVAMTGLSRRTLWRRVTEGAIAKREEDRGRAMLSLAAVVDLIPVPLDDDDLEMLVQADAGQPDAQADVGEMFYTAGEFGAAVYWLSAAAAQENADAMHWLGTCHFAGHGVPKSENIGLSWIARAAEAGHVIAQHQMESLKRSTLRS